MDETIRMLVRQRAGDQCEYCRLPQAAVDATFHVDHIIPLQHIDDAVDEPESLALACDRCNFCKGTNLSSVDPLTNISLCSSIHVKTSGSIISPSKVPRLSDSPQPGAPPCVCFK